MYVRLREFAGCLDCSSCELCDGQCFELGWLRGFRTIAGAGCARVVRTLIWWGELDVSCRVKSGQVGLSRVKSGDIFSSGPCCRYGFASVFSFRESIPGSGRFSTMLIHCSNRRQTHAGLLAVGGSGSGLEGSCRFMSGQVGGRSGQSGRYSYFGLWRLHLNTFPRCFW